MICAVPAVMRRAPSVLGAAETLLTDSPSPRPVRVRIARRSDAVQDSKFSMTAVADCSNGDELLCCATLDQVRRPRLSQVIVAESGKIDQVILQLRAERF